MRYSIIGSDSHVVGGVFVFGIGDGELGEPYFGSAEAGPSETGPWGTSSRFLELVGLGGLIGLIAFRWIVWAPALRRPLEGAPEGEREAVLAWGRDAFWVGFGVLAVGAMLAEGYLLIVQSASVLGTDVWSALRDATGISQVLGDTRFGSLVQLRGALLFAPVRDRGDPLHPRVRQQRLPAGGLPDRAPLVGGPDGRAPARRARGASPHRGTRTCPTSPRSRSPPSWCTSSRSPSGSSASRWSPWSTSGCRGSRPRRGGGSPSKVLARYSRVALVAVTVAVITGVIRSLAEVSDPVQLWETSYGQSILIKVALLIPIAALALYNRKVIVALRPVRTPNAATLRLVRRLAGAELVLSVAIVVVASVLVAQVPGAS